uniref:Uncharacterized protein n=1 Tax=Pararge aegeria TaxID=116150 RepID=S4PKL4_9NEOP
MEMGFRLFQGDTLKDMDGSGDLQLKVYSKYKIGRGYGATYNILRSEQPFTQTFGGHMTVWVVKKVNHTQSIS